MEKERYDETVVLMQKEIGEILYYKGFEFNTLYGLAKADPPLAIKGKWNCKVN